MKSSEIQIERAKSTKLTPGARVMSGVRATGRLHMGNYFGALEQWVRMQDQATCFFGVMDWHALTNQYRKSHDVALFARDIYAEMIGWGLDPKKSTLFIQSHVPEHIELATLFGMITPLPWLERVPTWKDAKEEALATESYNLGRLSYPVLQTADIAIYEGTHVPIGQDQAAHLEISRDIVARLNDIYKLNLPLPQPLFSNIPVLLGSDGRKMSKSYGNVIELTPEKKDLDKTLLGMPTDPARVRRTDPGDPEKCPVFSYHKLFTHGEDLNWVINGCKTAGIGCRDCKMKLSDGIESVIGPPRQKKQELLNDSSQLDSIIKDGCARAREVASGTLTKIKKAMGWSR